MKFHYLENTTRCFKYESQDDIRTYKPEDGWTAHADLIEINPITGEQMEQSEWWVFEKFNG